MSPAGRPCSPSFPATPEGRPQSDAIWPFIERLHRAIAGFASSALALRASVGVALKLGFLRHVWDERGWTVVAVLHFALTLAYARLFLPGLKPSGNEPFILRWRLPSRALIAASFGLLSLERGWGVLEGAVGPAVLFFLISLVLFQPIDGQGNEERPPSGKATTCVRETT